MGLFIGHIAKEEGAKIFMAERNWKRRNNYGPLIADKENLFDANSPELEKNILEKTDGGADIVIDTVGCLLRDAYKYVKKNGMILLFGLNKDAELNQYKLTREEINQFWNQPPPEDTSKRAKLLGSYLANWAFFDMALSWIESPDFQKFLDSLIYEKISLELLPRAINFMKDGKAIKMLIYPQENNNSFAKKLKEGTLEK